MTPETFIEHFETFAEAPNGVAKLRELILQLAVQGKLGTQDVNDEPAINDLTEIDSEKQAMIEARNLRPNRISEIEQTRVLQYAIPDSWRWFRLGDVAFFQEGPGIRNWQFRREGVKLLNVQNIVDGQLVLENSDRFVSIEEFEATYTHFRVEQGDILFASSGGSWGKTTWFEDPGYPVMLNTSMIRLKFFSKRCSDDYLLVFLRGQFFRKQMEIQLVGMQPNFGSTHLGRVYIPLPPLAEQRRIVGKVNQLLGLCDELAARQAARREARERLVGATLDRLVSARSAAEFPAHAHRLRDQFDRLFDTPTTLPQLRQAVLQLAVQGQLVPVRPSEEITTQALVSMERERMSLSFANGDQPKIEAEYATLRDAGPNEDGSRRFITARCICDFITKGTTPAADELMPEGDIPFLKVYNIVNNLLDFKYKPTFVRQTIHETQLRRSKIQPGNVLMNLVGPPLGKVAVVTDEYPEWNCNQALVIFKPISYYDSTFLSYIIGCPATLKEVLQNTRGTAGQDNISLEQSRNLRIPLVSLEYQRRFIAEVTELLSLCDALEAKLTQAESASTQLLSAAVHQLLKGD